MNKRIEDATPDVFEIAFRLMDQLDALRIGDPDGRYDDVRDALVQLDDDPIVGADVRAYLGRPIYGQTS